MSENYIVSARKYRPSSFGTVVGQQALTHTLKTAITSHRLAHAYLFCGPRGVGKTTCARIFAKAINCEHLTADGEPCNECESCRAFNEQRSYNIVELDAASNNSVDDIRNIVDQVRIPPQVGRYRVFIIDEVHMLSQAAFNAFLKTLEEPPEYAIFILATTEKQKIIPTILSRCQIYDFARITVPDIVQQLQSICQNEGIEAEPAALNVIAQKADGAMRDALSIFDQVNASSEGHITYQSAIDNLNVLDYDYYFRLDAAFLKGDVPQALLIYKEVRDHGFDSLFFINGLAQHIRDLMVASSPQTVSLLEMNGDIAQRHVKAAASFNPRFFYMALDLCNTCDLNYRDASNKQFLVELTLIKLCQLLNPQPPAGGNGGGQPQLHNVAPAQGQQPQPHQAAPAPQAATPTAPQAGTQPPAQPHPAVQTPDIAASTHTAYTPRPVVAASPNRIYINNQAAAAQQAASKQAAPATQATHRSAPFTAQHLLEAWNDYMKQHPEEKVIINTMRNSLPQRVTDDQYLIEVDNDAQVEFMENSMRNLLKFLRNAVNNDMLAIDVKLRKGGPRPTVMTDREIVENLRKCNPDFNQFIKDFELSMA